MQSSVVITLLVVASVVFARPDDFYDPKYDDFNVDEVIESIRLLKGYMHCFIGDGNCTPDGKNFKKWIPEAVQTSCGRCTPKQKALVAKVIKASKEKLPKEYDTLVHIHDPENKRHEALNDFLKEYGH